MGSKKTEEDTDRQERWMRGTERALLLVLMCYFLSICLNNTEPCHGRNKAREISGVRKETSARGRETTGRSTEI